MILATALFAAALQKPEILAVRCEAQPGGAVLKLLASAPLESVTTERSGLDAILVFAAVLPEQGLSLPQPIAPLRSLAFDATEPLVRLRIGLRPGTSVDARSDGSLLTLMFTGAGEQSQHAADVENLYPLLFPATGGAAAEDPGAVQPPSEEESSDGRLLRFLTLEPRVLFSYIDASATFLDTPTPVEARYLEIQPSLRLRVLPELSLFGVQVSLSYEPRFRTGANNIPVLSRPSHYFSGALETPLGSALTLSLADNYVRGATETQVVDPGREYFFDVGPFRRNEVSASLRSDMPGRIDFSLSGSVAKETVDPGTAYFGNERRAAQLAVRYELKPTTTATLSYSLERIPAPDSRPLAEMRGSGVAVGIEGELTPVIRGELLLGYRTQTNPRAAPGGAIFRGPTLAANIRRELANGGTFTLSGGRSTQPSAFENNAFYIINSVGLTLTMQVPFGFQLLSGVSLQRNDYRLPAQQLGVPRRDRLFGWSAGVSRNLTRWAYLRADYNRDRRRSNIPGFSVSTHSFVLQLGLSGSAIR